MNTFQCPDCRHQLVNDKLKQVDSRIFLALLEDHLTMVGIKDHTKAIRLAGDLSKELAD